MSTATVETLACSDCRFENEIERVYCHKCGARLDRSAVASRELPTPDPAKEAHQRVKAMFDGRGVKLRQAVMNFAKLLLGAVAVALVWEMSRAPELPPQKKTAELPAPIDMDLETMASYHRPPSLHYSQEEANAFLAKALKTRPELNHPLLDFRNATVEFAPGTARLTAGRSLFGFTFYTSGKFEPQLATGKLALAPVGGSIGHLPIHPRLMRYVGAFLFGDIGQALNRERRLIERAGGVQLFEKQIVFGATQTKK